MKRNILIVDDHPAICLLLSEFFSHEGYSVMVANTGKEAIEKLKKYTFDIVFLDYNIPIIDGVSVIKRLAHGGFLTPIVLMSGMSEKIKDKVSKHPFVKRIISKPFNLDEIKMFVQKTVRLANDA